MIINVDFSIFTGRFQDMGRADQFSRPALQALFNHIEELESDMGEPIELDVIALCCDFTESTPAEASEAYGVEEDEILGYLLDECALIAELRNGNILYRNV